MIRKFDYGDYHLRFNTETGFMARWGKTPEDDPIMCPIGPEIADIELSTICHGINGTPCSFCYKGNTGCGENMSVETFKKVFALFPKTLTQIAFGVGDIDGNPDMLRIFHYCRENGVMPNVTTNGMGVSDDGIGKVRAAALAQYCGAVAVSHYGNDDLCFNTIQNLTNCGLQQVNIHKLLAAETLESCHALIDKVATDPRCARMKAIVFLLLKPKGPRNQLHPVKNLESFHALYAHAMNRGVKIGMDSCSAPVGLKTIPMDNPMTLMSMEPCESTLFSIYVNVRAELFPCSFTEGTPGWEKGIDLLDPNIKNFTQDVWKGYRLQGWREKLLESSKGCIGCSMQKHCRSCPIYDISICKEHK